MDRATTRPPAHAPTNLRRSMVEFPVDDWKAAHLTRSDGVPLQPEVDETDVLHLREHPQAIRKLAVTSRNAYARSCAHPLMLERSATLEQRANLCGVEPEFAAAPLRCARRSAAPAVSRRAGVVDNLIGHPIASVAPAEGCRVSTTMSRARTCGCASISAMVSTGPAGTPAASSAASHIRRGFSFEALGQAVRPAHADCACGPALSVKRGSLTQFRCAENLREANEIRLVRTADRNPAVLRLESLVRRGKRMRRAQRSDFATRAEENRALPEGLHHARLEQRRVDQLALAGAQTMHVRARRSRAPPECQR